MLLEASSETSAFDQLLSDIALTSRANNSLTAGQASDEGLGYGTDLRCGFDLEPDMASVDPFSTLAVAEAVLRRLDCPRGANPDDPNYGISVRSMLNRGVTDTDIRALGDTIRLEVLEDDRVDQCTVRVVPAQDASSLTVQLIITPFDASLDEFSLTFEATSGGLVVQEIAAS